MAQLKNTLWPFTKYLPPSITEDGLSSINALVEACERGDGIDQHCGPDLIIARDEIVRLRYIVSQDTAFATERAAAFTAHCDERHNADFEVCPDPRCRAVVVEEARRGLLYPGDVWPPIEPDDKPNYMPIHVCLVTDESGALNIAGVLSDYGAAVNWLDADRDNRALLFFALNKMTGEYATNKEAQPT